MDHQATDRAQKKHHLTESGMDGPFAGKLSVCRQYWTPRIEDTAAERSVMALAQQHGMAEMAARVLVGRGVMPEQIHDVMYPTLKAWLPDPAHLHDIQPAIERLAKAIALHEHMAVFGDYDVDGATSSALLKRYCTMLGQKLTLYIPDRTKEGYGPNLAAFELLASQGVTLIITVDCGTLSYEPIAAMQARGVDVIVIDHHQAQPQLPKARAIINPNRIDQDSPCQHLAAVGVTFLVLVALNRHLRETGYFADKTEPDLLQWLDLVALGTVCDVMPITGLNRAFVAQGLKVIAQRRNPGIAAIADVARLDEAAGAYHLGFLIGPRINAGGRVGESALGSQILSQDEAEECAMMAQRLDRYNAERQAIEASVLDEAQQQAAAQQNAPCIAVYAEGWHEGVIGIVAGRLKEQFQRPALVMSSSDGKVKGSARSVPGVDIGAAIAAATQLGLILGGGGHMMAAGFSLTTQQIDGFVAFLQERLASQVARYELGRTWRYDGVLAVSAVTMALHEQLEQLGPYGMGFPGPRFIIADATITRADVMKEKHLRLYLVDSSSSKTLTAVAFNAVGQPLGDAVLSHIGKPLHVAGSIRSNWWNGRASVQWMLEDVMLAGK